MPGPGGGRPRTPALPSVCPAQESLDKPLPHPVMGEMCSQTLIWRPATGRGCGLISESKPLLVAPQKADFPSQQLLG